MASYPMYNVNLIIRMSDEIGEWTRKESIIHTCIMI